MAYVPGYIGDVFTTPSYRQSDFCITEELNYFVDQFGSHVFQLLMAPIPEGVQPPQPTADYEKFYDETIDLPLVCKYPPPTSGSCSTHLFRAHLTSQIKQDNLRTRSHH